MSIDRLFHHLGLDRLINAEPERIKGKTFWVWGGTHDTGLRIAKELKLRGATKLLLGGKPVEDKGHYKEAEAILGSDFVLPVLGDLQYPDQILSKVKEYTDQGIVIDGVIDAASAGLFKVMYYLARERGTLNKAGITSPAERRQRYLDIIREQNEKAMDKAYLMNVTAHERILDELPYIISRGGIYVYISSLFSSFVRDGEYVPDFYKVIALTKGAFEEKLAERAPCLTLEHGIDTAVVTGDLLEDTTTRQGFDDFQKGFPEFVGDFKIDHRLPKTGDMAKAAIRLITSPRSNKASPRYLYVVGPGKIIDNREKARKVVRSYVVNKKG